MSHESNEERFKYYYNKLVIVDGDIKEQLNELKINERDQVNPDEYQSLIEDINDNLKFENQLFQNMIFEEVYWSLNLYESKTLSDKDYKKTKIFIYKQYVSRCLNIFKQSIYSSIENNYYYISDKLNMENEETFDEDYAQSNLSNALYLDGLIYVLDKIKNKVSDLEEKIIYDSDLLKEYENLRDMYLEFKYSFMFYHRKLCEDLLNGDIPNSYCEELINDVKFNYHYDLTIFKFEYIYNLYNILISELNIDTFYVENKQLTIIYYKYMIEYCLSMFSKDHKEAIKSGQFQKIKIMQDIFKDIN